MFSKVSWGSYITVTLFLLAAYYAFVILKYYGSDLSQLLSGRKAENIDTKKNIVTRPSELLMQQATDDQDLSRFSQTLADEMLALLHQAGYSKLNKYEIIKALQLLITKHADLKKLSLRKSIQNLIQTECETNCSVHLSEEDLSGLWN